LARQSEQVDEIAEMPYDRDVAPMSLVCRVNGGSGAMRAVLTAIALGVAGILVQAARADVIYSFEVEQAGYSLTSGQSIQVPVYLTETVTEPSTSLLASEGGLWSAGVLLQRTDSSLGSPVLLTAAVANEADFDDLPAITLVADDGASILELRDLGQTMGVLPDEAFPGSGIRRVYLGSFTLTAGAAAGEVTTFYVGDNTTDDTRTWLSFTLLDEDIQATSFTATVVPEPTTMVLLAAGALGLFRRKR
jgi:hypothetical protein